MRSRRLPPLVLSLLLLAGCDTAPAAGRSAAPSAAATRSAGWQVTVYYTAVEEYHDGAPTPVLGCPALNCAYGDSDLGTYPAGFVTAVRDEGTGLTRAGRYLNWSHDTGFWLDTAPRDAHGGALQPLVSAAADPDVLPAGAAVRITGCGALDNGSAVPSPVCATLRGADWRIADEFTPGLGGAKHLDVYLGPESGPGFTDSEWYTTLIGATLTIG